MRGGDSFAAFEEVLIQSKAQKADLLLLGGDLFHDNKPSRNTLHRCARFRRRRPPHALSRHHTPRTADSRSTFDILRNHTLGEDPVQFQASARAHARARRRLDRAGPPRARAKHDRRPVGGARGDARAGHLGPERELCVIVRHGELRGPVPFDLAPRLLDPRQPRRPDARGRRGRARGPRPAQRDQPDQLLRAVQRGRPRRDLARAHQERRHARRDLRARKHAGRAAQPDVEPEESDLPSPRAQRRPRQVLFDPRPSPGARGRRHPRRHARARCRAASARCRPPPQSPLL